MDDEQEVGFELQKNDAVGRFAVASKDLKAGALISTDRPFAYGPKSGSPPVCLGCYAYLDCTTLCSKCGWPVCSSKCENIPAHRDYECCVFAKTNVKFATVEDPYAPNMQYECITPLRVLLASEKDPDTWNKYIICMQAHTEKRKKLEIWEFYFVNVVNYLRGPCKLDRFGEELIHQVCGFLDVNAFEARTLSGNLIRCLYPKLVVFSHNCVSNTTHSIFANGEGDASDYKLTVRASVPITKDSELFSSYTYLVWPTIVRRAFLKENKYFECNCARCSDPTEIGTHMGTLKCTKCDNGIILSTAPLDAEAEWKCTHCENTIRGGTIKKIYKTIQDEIDQVDNMEQDASAIEAREALYRKYRSVLHPRNAYETILRISLAQMYGKTEGYTMDVLPDILYERKIELCQQVLESLNILTPGYTRLRAMMLYELHAPIIMLARSLYNTGAIEKDELRSKLQEASKLLEETATILILEPENSPEGMIGRMAKNAYDQLTANMDELIENI